MVGPLVAEGDFAIDWRVARLLGGHLWLVLGSWVRVLMRLFLLLGLLRVLGCLWLLGPLGLTKGSLLQELLSLLDELTNVHVGILSELRQCFSCGAGSSARAL